MATLPHRAGLGRRAYDALARIRAETAPGRAKYPRVQNFSFVRGVYFALKRRGLSPGNKSEPFPVTFTLKIFSSERKKEKSLSQIPTENAVRT